MHRIVVVGNGRAARLVVEQIRTRMPDVAFTIFGPDLPARERNWFARHQVDLRPGVVAMEVDRFARKITGSDGSRTVFHRLILTDFSPELARRAKLQMATGLLVNTYMQTSDGYVYALGDSVEGPPGLNLASLAEQAKIVATHVCASSPRMFIAAEFAPAL